MSAQYRCDICDKDMMDVPYTVITANGQDGHAEYHLCQKCTEAHIEPIFEIVFEAEDRRTEAWNREYERRRKEGASNNAASDATDPPGFS
jgi:hypothetical protein